MGRGRPRCRTLTLDEELACELASLLGGRGPEAFAGLAAVPGGWLPGGSRGSSLRHFGTSLRLHDVRGETQRDSPQRPTHHRPTHHPRNVPLLQPHVAVRLHLRTDRSCLVRCYLSGGAVAAA